MKGKRQIRQEFDALVARRWGMGPPADFEQDPFKAIEQQGIESRIKALAWVLEISVPYFGVLPGEWRPGEHYGPPRGS